MNIIESKLIWNKSLEKLNIEEIAFIVIHHIEAQNASIEEIHRWHIENGWAGCGYNEYIRKDGTVYIGRGMHIGAHTQNFNHCSYGIALEGDFNKESPTQKQLDSLIERIKDLKESFPAKARVTGHNALCNTECPGKNFPLMDVIRLAAEVKIDTELENALKDLQDYLIISVPKYWQDNAKPNKICNGEYVRQLIINVANTLMVIKTPPN
jgi:N-acetylmuramoyl-L-alanine amidase